MTAETSETLALSGFSQCAAGSDYSSVAAGTYWLRAILSSARKHRYQCRRVSYDSA
jgi:hypothetical protein